MINKKIIEITISNFLFRKFSLGGLENAQTITKELLKYLDDCNLEVKFKE